MKLKDENIPEFDAEIFINQGQDFTNQSYCVGEETFLKNVWVKKQIECRHTQSFHKHVLARGCHEA